MHLGSQLISQRWFSRPFVANVSVTISFITRAILFPGSPCREGWDTAVPDMQPPTASPSINLLYLHTRSKHSTVYVFTSPTIDSSRNNSVLKVNIHLCFRRPQEPQWTPELRGGKRKGKGKRGGKRFICGRKFWSEGGGAQGGGAGSVQNQQVGSNGYRQGGGGVAGVAGHTSFVRQDSSPAGGGAGGRGWSEAGRGRRTADPLPDTRRLAPRAATPRTGRHQAGLLRAPHRHMCSRSFAGRWCGGCP